MSGCWNCLVLFFFRQLDVGIMVQIGFDTLLKQGFRVVGWIVCVGIKRSGLRMQILHLQQNEMEYTMLY